MKLDADTLERAAFACFGNKLEDNYKRLLFLNLDKVVRENPNISSGKCFALLSNAMTVSRQDFDCAVAAMEMPFKRFSINRYTRKVDPNNQRAGTRKVSHIHLTDSELWSTWVTSVISKYPELSLWV